MEYPSTNALLRVIIRHLTNPAEEQKPSESGRPTVRLVSAKYYQAETGVNNTFLTWELRNHVVGLYLNVSAEWWETTRDNYLPSPGQASRTWGDGSLAKFSFSQALLARSILWWPADNVQWRIMRAGQATVSTLTSVSLFFSATCSSVRPLHSRLIILWDSQWQDRKLHGHNFSFRSANYFQDLVPVILSFSTYDIRLYLIINT